MSSSLKQAAAQDTIRRNVFDPYTALIHHTIAKRFLMRLLMTKLLRSSYGLRRRFKSGRPLPMNLAQPPPTDQLIHLIGAYPAIMEACALLENDYTAGLTYCIFGLDTLVTLEVDLRSLVAHQKQIAALYKRINDSHIVLQKHFEEVAIHPIRYESRGIKLPCLVALYELRDQYFYTPSTESLSAYLQQADQVADTLEYQQSCQIESKAASQELEHKLADLRLELEVYSLLDSWGDNA